MKNVRKMIINCDVYPSIKQISRLIAQKTKIIIDIKFVFRKGIDSVFIYINQNNLKMTSWKNTKNAT